ncbi:uncharacterized protein LOC122030135 isoform X1 [Zingiber officinale]|uniref:uncharacterized protein LOC122030135 isoform X1 n=2 Tax=Zingiber officinale TaxID=94328 RepID=UPI001C4C698D|nr:uncharacterized protein LOC122030135 isoform X1 [Zingiber officinale]XP_042445225.1 uncharacterized protein LOC122030135 isoform X1 [Zingiber officinale]XP_042445226.1 uncharacterized protein LOC122030135 isoform X1 [Zingiber officinale]XP_042445227.1 uncharacterized protein LOC122030135 isoform X1 [Zingiber officinale]XP_042445228.1 uncharacterized protein LOC122030135 isoform X1 [Zingiber officinale]XP_042445229.1 uncharacterized protein LOC122030135 isoform X1 [Zingiber officinale]
MEANLNNGFYQESRSSQFNYPRMVCFQSSAIDSSTGMAPGDVPTMAGNTNMEMMPWFRHVSSTPEYWSPDEVETLNKGLINFASESRIQKFTKIAAMLPQKTIRDVALRCQWMINKENGKRRKTEEYYATKKIKDMKEKMMGFPSTNTSMAPNLLTMHHMSIHYQLRSEELKSLLEKNEKCLKEIARNLEGGMMQDNISLFHRTRNNIATLENRITILSRGMNQLPGSLRQMPSMPVTVNDRLLSSLAPLDEHVNINTPGSGYLKPDPTCFRPPERG